MSVLGFTMLILTFVVSHPILNPCDIYDITEQYRAATTKYYAELYEAREAQKINKVQTTQPTVVQVANGDAGHLEIPSIGVNVGLYYDSNAFQCSNKASYQYWIQYGKFWIADHNYQDGFGDLKNISIGSVVNVCDEYGSCRSYTVAESVYYADYYSDFEGCGAFSKMMDYKNVGGIVLQTCEGNDARLVFCK